MNPSTDQICHAISSLKSLVSQGECDENQLRRMGLGLAEFADAANATDKMTLFRAGDLLSRLLESAATWQSRFPDDAGVVQEIFEFVANHVGVLEEGIENEQANVNIESMIDSANAMWADYILMNEASWEPGFRDEFGAEWCRARSRRGIWTTERNCNAFGRADWQCTAGSSR